MQFENTAAIGRSCRGTATRLTKFALSTSDVVAVTQAIEKKLNANNPLAQITISQNTLQVAGQLMWIIFGVEQNFSLIFKKCLVQRSSRNFPGDHRSSRSHAFDYTTGVGLYKMRQVDYCTTGLQSFQPAFKATLPDVPQARQIPSEKLLFDR